MRVRIHLHTKTEKEKEKKKSTGQVCASLSFNQNSQALLTCIIAGTTSPQAPGPGLSLQESYRSSAKAAS